MNQREKTKSESSWGWGIVALFSSFALFIILLVIYASSQRHELVEPEYYARELAYQDQIDRIRRTKALEQGLEIHYSHLRSTLSLSFPHQPGGSPSGTVQLFRPSDARQDQVHSIVVDETNSMLLSSRNMIPGMWRVLVTWSQGGEDYFDAQEIVIPGEQ